MQLSISTRLALAVAGAGLALSGIVLALRATWGGLALALGPLWASAILGASLAVVGALLLATAQAARRKPPPPSPMATLVGAFLEGLRAGRATGSRGP